MARVGSAYSDYRLNLSGFEQDISHILQRMAQVQSAIAQAAQGAASVSARPNTSSSSPGNANSILALQRAQASLEAQEARLARAQNDTARAAQLEAQAEQRLQGIIAAQTTTTTQTIAAQRQLVGVQQQVARASQQGSGIAGQFGDALKSSLLGVVGPAAAAALAVRAIGAAFQATEDAFKLKAELDATTASINAQLQGARDIGQVWGEAQAFASRYNLTQQETTQILGNSIDVLRQSTSSVGDLESALIRLNQRDASKPITEAARALRELQAGDVTSIKELFNVPAAKAAEMKRAIAGGADAVKVLDAYLTSAGIGADALDQRLQGASGKMREAAAEAEQLQLALAGQAGGAGEWLLDKKIEATRVGTRLLSGDVATMGQSLLDNANRGSVAFDTLAGVFPGLGTSIRQAAGEYATLQAAQAQVAASTDASAHAATGAAAGYEQWTQALLANQQQQQAISAATQKFNQDLTDNATKQNAASVESQLLALRQQQLMAQAQAAAGGLIATGQASIDMANQFIASGNEAQRLIGLLIKLSFAQAAVGGARAPGITEDRAERQTPAQSAGAALAGRNAMAEATEKARQAELEYQRTLKNFGPSIAAAEAELAKLPKTGEAYWKKLNEITQLKESQQSAIQKGAGGARVSAQQGVLNKLEDQAIKYDQRMEDAEQSHQQRLATIEKRYQEQRLKAERSFAQQQLDSRADFYLSLADIEDQGLRQALAQKYEEVQQKAAQIRQQYGADAAADYEREARKIVEQETKLQDQINKLRSKTTEDGGKKSKDQQKANAAQAAYLEGVLRLQQQANQNRLQQIEQGGSQIENDRAQAVADEATSYADAQASIAESSGRATDKVVLDAQRRKIAVDAENESLAKTQGFYDRIQGAGAATSAGSAPVGTATPPASSVPAQAQGASAAPSDTAALAVADTAVASLLAATNGILQGGFAAVVASLGELGRRIVAVENAVRSAPAMRAVT